MIGGRRVVIAVFAEAPLPGQCAKPLLPFHDEAWLARLYAAMLRDTLDGLEATAAERYLVIPDALVDAEGRRALERHLPVPWTLASLDDVARDAFVIVARAEAPAAQLESLAEATARGAAVIGPAANGDAWLVGREPAPALVVPSAESAAAFRAECTNVVLLPEAIIVDSTAAMEALFEELRRHHERAPRTAIVAMTR